MIVYEIRVKEHLDQHWSEWFDGLMISYDADNTFSGRDNLRVLARTTGLEDTRRIADVLGIVGLAQRAQDRVKTYSLGMKQRLAIAAALLNNPQILFLDEPTNGLDPAGTVEVRELIKYLAASGHTIFLIVRAIFGPSRVAYGFPGAFLVVGEALGFLGAFLAIVYGALLVGNEYQYDTWKNLLTRHAGREVFIFSKWPILVICVVLGSLLLLLFAQGIGWLLSSTIHLRGAAASAYAGTVLLLVGVQALTPVVAGGFAIMGAVIGRSSVAGIMMGLVWFIADAAGGQFLPGVSRLVSFGVASSNLQAYIMGPAAPFRLLCCLVVVVYLVIPIVMAAFIFRKRDMLGAS